MATSDGSVKAPEELGLERSQAAAAPEKRPKRHYKNIRVCAAGGQDRSSARSPGMCLHSCVPTTRVPLAPAPQTDFPVLEQRVTDLTLELQRARSEREAHQTLHGALVMLERYQSNLLQAGARAGLRLPEDGAGAGQELRGPDASQPAAPGFFQGLFGRIHLAFPRLKQNMTLALIRGGFYVPTDDELRHDPGHGGARLGSSAAAAPAPAPPQRPRAEHGARPALPRPAQELRGDSRREQPPGAQRDPARVAGLPDGRGARVVGGDPLPGRPPAPALPHSRAAAVGGPLQWEKSPDAGVRAKIEARMRNFRDLRTKFLRSFIRHRPEVLPKALTLRVTPAPEDCSAEERGTCSSLLHPSLAAVVGPGCSQPTEPPSTWPRAPAAAAAHTQEQMPWTGEEREGVLLAWDAYCRRTAAIRQRASVELDAMATSSALRSIYAWEATDNNRSLCHLMGAYTELANSVGGCEAWMRLEVLAYAEFFCACVEVSCTRGRAAREGQRPGRAAGGADAGTPPSLRHRRWSR